MNEEIRYTPHGKNRKAWCWSIGLMLLGAATFAFSYMAESYRGGIQMAALLLIVCGLFFLLKYIYITTTYVLGVTEAGTPYFLVEQMQGKRISTVYQVSLRRVFSIRKWEFGKGSAPRGRYYSYVATPGRRDYQVITARASNGAHEYVKIEADEAFYAAFCRRLAALRAEESAADLTEETAQMPSSVGVEEDVKASAAPVQSEKEQKREADAGAEADPEQTGPSQKPDFPG